MLQQFWCKSSFVYFLLAKYVPMSHKNDGQKREWRYPTVCVGGYFIQDKNIQTYLICLQRCNMQKHQKANFRTVEYEWMKIYIARKKLPHKTLRVHSARYTQCIHVSSRKLKLPKDMHSYQKVQTVCLCTTMMVESEHNACFMTHHDMKHAFISNLHKINNANRVKHCCYK